MLEAWFHFVFFYLAVLQPFGSWRRMAAAARSVAAAEATGASPPARRLTTRGLYLGVIFGQWAVALGVVYVFWRLGIPLGALGLAPPHAMALGIAAVVLAIAWVFWVRYQQRSLADPVKVAKLQARFDRVSILVPSSDAEERMWVMVSITAGVCEEVMYRGFVGFYLGRYVPLGWAAVIGTVVFAVAHLYQGPRNALRTGILGAIFWALYGVTGSIFPGMVLHAALDIRSGQVLRRAFVKTAPAAA